MHTFPGPLLLNQLITNLNQGLPGPSPRLPVLSSSGSGVGLVFVLGCFPTYKPGEAGCWFLILQGQFRERNLNPVLSCGGRPGLYSFVTGQLVTPGAGLPQRPAAWFTPLSLGTLNIYSEGDTSVYTVHSFEFHRHLENSAANISKDIGQLTSVSLS